MVIYKYHRLISMCCLLIINRLCPAPDYSSSLGYSGTSYSLPAGSIKPYSIVYSPDGSLLATENTGSNTVTLFKVDLHGSLTDGTSYPVPTAPPDGFTSVAFSPNGKYLATADGYANRVTIFTIEANGTLSSGTSYTPPPTAVNPGAVAFSPNGLFLASANGESITLFAVAPTGTLSIIANIPVSGPRTLSYSPDGLNLASANYLINKITVLDQKGVPTVYNLPAQSTAPFAVAYSPDGSYLATANKGSHDITLFSVETTGMLSPGISYPLPSEAKGPVALVFSPDGTMLATANVDSNNITVMKVGKQGLYDATIYPLPAISKAPMSITFSSAGPFLATANAYSNDVTVFKRKASDNPDSDLGLILGIVIASVGTAAVVLSCIAGFYLYMYKHRRNRYTVINSPSDHVGQSSLAAQIVQFFVRKPISAAEGL